MNLPESLCQATKHVSICVNSRSQNDSMDASLRFHRVRDVSRTLTRTTELWMASFKHGRPRTTHIREHRISTRVVRRFLVANCKILRHHWISCPMISTSTVKDIDNIWDEKSKTNPKSSTECAEQIRCCNARDGRGPTQKDLKECALDWWGLVLVAYCTWSNAIQRHGVGKEEHSGNRLFWRRIRYGQVVHIV